LSLGEHELTYFERYLVRNGIISDGDTIERIYNQHQRVGRQCGLWGKITLYSLLFSLVLMFVYMVLEVCAPLFDWGGWWLQVPHRKFAPLYFATGLLPLALWLMYLQPRGERQLSIVKRVETELRKPHPKGELLGVHTNQSIGTFLDTLADKYLRCESAARICPRNSVDEIARCGQLCSEFTEFAQKFDAAIDGFNMRFGSTFIRSELLREAQLRAATAAKVLTRQDPNATRT
jgi:hypothetical protein